MRRRQPRDLYILVYIVVCGLALALVFTMDVCDRERERAAAAKEAAVAAAKEALVHAVELQALEQVVALGEEAEA